MRVAVNGDADQVRRFLDDDGAGGGASDFGSVDEALAAWGFST